MLEYFLITVGFSRGHKGTTINGNMYRGTPFPIYIYIHMHV